MERLSPRPRVGAVPTSPSAARAALLAEVEGGWRRLDQLVRGLSPSESETPVGPDGRTVGGVVLHLAAWKRNAARVARMQTDPASEPTNLYPAEVLGFEVDDFNEGIVLASRGRQLTEVVAEHQTAHLELMALIEPLPDHRLLVDGRPRRWLAPVRWHPARHLDEDILPALGRA